MKIEIIIRVFLSAALCVMIYKETGLFTTIFAVLVIIYGEIQSYLFDGTVDTLKLIRETLEKTLEKHLHP